MSYIPTTWTTGDIVTAEKLNKLENGIISGAIYIPITYNAENQKYSISASYNDIISMIENGQSIFGIIDANNIPDGAVAKELLLPTGYASMSESDIYQVVFISVLQPNFMLEFKATDPSTPMASESMK